MVKKKIRLTDKFEEEEEKTKNKKNSEEKKEKFGLIADEIEDIEERKKEEAEEEFGIDEDDFEEEFTPMPKARQAKLESVLGSMFPQKESPENEEKDEKEKEEQYKKSDESMQGNDETQEELKALKGENIKFEAIRHGKRHATIMGEVTPASLRIHDRVKKEITEIDEQEIAKIKRYERVKDARDEAIEGLERKEGVRKGGKKAYESTVEKDYDLKKAIGESAEAPSEK